MPSPFDVDVQPLSLTVGAGQKGEVQFTVTNRSGAPLVGRAEPVTTPSGLAAWVTADGDDEVRFDADQTRTFRFVVAPPAATEPQAMQFHLDWVDVADPSNRVTRSPAVKVTVAAGGGGTRPWWPYAVAAAVVILGVAAAIYFIKRPRIDVPALVDLSPAGVDSVVAAVPGLAVQRRDSFAPDKPVGQVLAQHPAAGDRVSPSRAVEIVVVADSGVVPPVSDEQANVADSILRAAGFSAAQVDTAAPAEIAAGLVLRQQPAAGTPARRSEPVRLWVVPGDGTVPNVTGSDEPAARQRIRAEGFVDSVVYEAQLQPPFGRVLRQEPQNPARHPRGSPVVAVVSTEGTQVPPVIGQTLESASSLIANNRLITGVGTRYTRNAAEVGQIGGQRPDPRAVVPVNSEVTVLVNRLCTGSTLIACARDGVVVQLPQSVLERGAVVRPQARVLARPDS